MACEARQEGDEMACACGLRWSVADVEPPQCRRVRHVVPVPSAQRELLAGARKEANFLFSTGSIDAIPNLGDRRYFAYVEKRLLLEPPRSLLEAMDRAHRAALAANAHRPDGYLAAMQAVYRIFLDSLS